MFAINVFFNVIEPNNNMPIDFFFLIFLSIS